MMYVSARPDKHGYVAVSGIFRFFDDKAQCDFPLPDFKAEDAEKLVRLGLLRRVKERLDQ